MPPEKKNVKVVCLGEQGVGATTLFAAMSRSSYQFSGITVPTLGGKEFSYKRIENEETLYIFSFWLLTGPKGTQSLNVYLKDAEMVWFFIDAEKLSQNFSEELDRLRERIEQVRCYADVSQIKPLIVITKADLVVPEELQQLQKQLQVEIKQQDFPLEGGCEIIVASAHTGQGVKELFENKAIAEAKKTPPTKKDLDKLKLSKKIEMQKDMLGKEVEVIKQRKKQHKSVKLLYWLVSLVHNTQTTKEVKQQCLQDMQTLLNYSEAKQSKKSKQELYSDFRTKYYGARFSKNRLAFHGVANRTEKLADKFCRQMEEERLQRKRFAK